MRYLWIAIVLGTLGTLLPCTSYAEPYAEHNATRNLPQTLKEIKKSGNWESFITGYMLNHPDFASVEEAEESFLQIKPEDIYLCPEGLETMTAGVKNGTTGTYKPEKCRPGEFIAFRNSKPVMSLYCGNLVLETMGFGPKPKNFESTEEQVVTPVDVEESERDPKEASVAVASTEKIEAVQITIPSHCAYSNSHFDTVIVDESDVSFRPISGWMVGYGFGGSFGNGQRSTSRVSHSHSQFMCN